MKLTDLVGNTPLVELTRMHERRGVRIFGKMEGDNPGGSVKDRPPSR
jgi:S-sulfo-L-cysteine synthase (O-acetyl-L-serine-dependent)